MTDDFEHLDRADRDIGGYTYSRPTDDSTVVRTPGRPDDVVSAMGTSDRWLSTDGSPLQDGEAPAALATASAWRVVAIVCAVVVVLCWFIAGILGADQDDLDQRLQYQECITQEQARIARDGSLLQPEDFCDLYPGR